MSRRPTARRPGRWVMGEAPPGTPPAPDVTAPLLVSITIPTNGLTAAFLYDEALDSGSTPAAGAYTFSGTSSTAASVAIVGDTVTVTFNTAVLSGETVLASYTAGGAPVQDISGNDAANLTNNAVTNNSTAGGGDVTAPTLTSITIATNGLTAAFLYNEALDTGSVPAAGAFSFSGTSSTASSVGVSGSTVTVTFNTAVGIGQTVLASYTAGAAPIQDTAGNDAANLTNNATTNNSTVDITAPSAPTIATATDGTYVDLTFAESMDQTSTPAAGAFNFDVTLATPGTPVWQSATVLRVPAVGRILASEAMTLDYTAGGSPIQDLAGNDLANLSNAAVTNNSLYALETVVDTQVANGSIADTEYVVGHPGGAFVWGGGGGGDGGVTNGATGQAGYLAMVAVAAMAAGGYSWTLGTGGAAGTAGTATDGTSSEFLDPSSTVLARGIGGAAGDSTGPTGGSGGNGDTSVGDTIRAGGDGTGGTGNRAGGATSGTSTAASGATPGFPEGIPGTTADNANPGRGVGGTVRTGTPLVGKPGGDGMVIVYYQRAVLAAQPRIKDVAYGRDAANATSRVLTFGGSYAANDRLVALSIEDGQTSGGSMANYTELCETGTTSAVMCHVRDADGTGSDTATLVTNSCNTTWLTYRIAGAAAVANADLTATTRTNAQIDPPSHTHGAGAVDGLWIACGGGRVTLPLRISAWSSGYSQRLSIPARSSGGAACTLASCVTRLTATATENPGAFTSDSNSSGGQLTAVFPKA